MGGKKIALFLSIVILLLLCCCVWCEKSRVENKKKLEDDVISILRRKLESLQKESLTNSDGNLKKEIELVKMQIQDLQKYEKGDTGKKVDPTLGEKPGVESVKGQPFSLEEAGDRQDAEGLDESYRLDYLEGVEDYEEEILEQMEQVEVPEVVEEAGDAEEEQPAYGEEDDSLPDVVPDSVKRTAEGVIDEFEEAEEDEGADADEAKLESSTSASSALVGGSPLGGSTEEEKEEEEEKGKDVMQGNFQLEEQGKDDVPGNFKLEKETKKRGQPLRETSSDGDKAIKPPLSGQKPNKECFNKLHKDVGLTKDSANQINPPPMDDKGKDEGQKYKSPTQNGDNSVGANNFGGCSQGENSNGTCPLDIFKKVLEDENFLQEFDNFIHNLYGYSKKDTPCGRDQMENENLYMDLLTNALSFLNTIEVI
ncbi:hypothetical protein C922_01840 [Plasmodium inui San Antonio 1]|uniref:Merozoite surface protein C-terminal domain-containing protein n=1 Tax=Plasmodium inui San Antonio 1 TaxID=1237626 RepID=W7A7P8_9APIC|nr:hypothetical protein C922_01840 [Plasmodium inui San Antonio 1]EUD67655.1 hypothetical protein C922_01840 [Plasmodium inui San Antonio 1]